MRTLSLALAAALVLAAPLRGQNETEIEIGTSLGVTISIPGGGADTEVFIDVPGGGTFIGRPTVFLTVFATPSVMIEPQIAFSWNSIIEQVIFSGILQVGYLFTPTATGSFYVAADGGYFTIGSDNNSVTVGGAAGYRVRIGDAAALRVQARFLRWLDDAFDLNEVTASIGLGVVLP